ncbi:MAG: tetratricopeptide repeat protein [Polyangiaceae bacterium]
MSDTCNPTSLEEELAIARAALDGGDLRHSAHHLAAALVCAPAGLEVAQLVKRLFHTSRDPHGLIPEKMWTGDALLRARFFELSGAYDDALAWQLMAQGAARDQPVLHLEPWLDEERSRVVDQDRLGRELGKLLDNPIAVEQLWPLLEHLRAQGPLSVWLSFHVVRLLRARNRNEEALELASATHDREASYWSATSLASTLRTLGRLEEAVARFREAAELDPRDVAVHLDLGDILLDLGRPEDAEQAYSAALERDPESSWALASLAYARWKRGGDAHAAARVVELARAGNERAASLTAEVAPYDAGFRRPASSLVNSFASAGEDSIVQCAVSSLEAPSCVLAVQLEAGWRGQSPPLVRWGEIPEPDPRLPRGETTRRLWTYLDSSGELERHAMPALLPPTTDALELVSSIATGRYDLEQWWEAARRRADQLSARLADQLFACMLHPPPTPQDEYAWNWLFKVQIAASLLLAQTSASWDEARGHQALIDLLGGPVDWITSAGIIATCQLGRAVPRRLDEVSDLLRPLSVQPRYPAEWANIAEVMVEALGWLPELPLELAEWRAAIRAQLDE